MSESQLIEYKESWRDEYLKWICASFACQNSFSKTQSGLRRFANAQGGVLYIGKRDDGSVCGVADSKKLMALIHQDFSVGVPVQISVYKDKLYISNDCVFPANWTADTLMQKHRSLPHNPDIANTFFRAGFIESWGRGIEKICNLCKEYGIAEPEYTVHPNDIMMMFKASEPVNEPVNEPVKLVLAVIADNPNLSKEKIAEKIGMSRATVTRALAKLVEIGAIQRVGSDKSGHWEIVENGV